MNDLFTARVRGLQHIYGAAHLALVNWGRWSGDNRGKPQRAKNGTWDQYRASEGDEYGEESDQPQRVEDETEIKAEGPDLGGYDERQAVILDERIHHPGGLNVETRRAIRTAYVSRETPEDQFPRHAGCTEDAFCERLETALRFVGRFI